jgi:hypothetical protein
MFTCEISVPEFGQIFAVNQPYSDPLKLLIHRDELISQSEKSVSDNLEFRL